MINSPFLTSRDQIMKINELAGAVTVLNEAVPGGITGNDTDNVMIAYTKNPDKIVAEIPVEMTTLPVQERNLEFIVPVWGASAGTTILFPGSLFFAGGI